MTSDEPQACAGQRPERVRREAAALILGVPGRIVTLMARRGEIPSAALIGRTWTFNEQRLRAWMQAKQDDASMAALTMTRYAALWRERVQYDRSAARKEASDRAYAETMATLLRDGRRKP